MYSRTRLNNDWYYYRDYNPGMESGHLIKNFDSVCLPHANIELPYNYFDETDYQFCSSYCRRLPELVLKQGQFARIRFEGVMASTTVYLNGMLLGEHLGGYTPFEFDLPSRLLKMDGTDLVYVVVDSREREDIPPFGGQIDYLTYGGIYRDVSLDIYEAVHINNIKLECKDALAASKELEILAFLGNTGLDSDVELSCSISECNGTILKSISQVLKLAAGQSHHVLLLSELNGLELWTLESPVLYCVSICVKALDSTDSCGTSYGFRSAEFKPDGFFLNGERLQLRGLNRHQSWPYVGYAMPARAQKKDADILKHELGTNMVRTSHYPQSIDFLDRCDQIGLLVFEEIPGWQYIGSAKWKKIALQNVDEMIKRDWNHPSVVIWGVRINESADDDDLYEQTNRLAHQLDASRPTGGVRYICGSHLLEDVYTMNDFIHSGGSEVLRDQRVVTGLDTQVPYLVTEYNGHMYPTKRTDNEERQCEHVLRHLRVQNAAYADPGISGAIGWCAFDYNTHKDFGSGDRICYHGVMDMFRLPKFAAWVYRSQRSPHVDPVLMPVTWWARGERSIGGVLPLIVLTNCDSLTLRFGNHEAIPVVTKDENFTSLPYPPFIVDTRHISPEKLGAWGMKWEDLLITGFVDGLAVVTYRMVCNPVPSILDIVADDSQLISGEKDVTRCIVRILDQAGNVLPFCDTIIEVKLSGPARIQGPSRFALRGGTTAFWVESDGTPGLVELSVDADGFQTQRLVFSVVAHA